MKKRFLSFVLAVLMIMCTVQLAFPASAEYWDEEEYDEEEWDEEEEDYGTPYGTTGFYYEINDDEQAVITYYDGDESSLTIPSEIEGYPVTEIGDDAFASCYVLESIVIPNSVTSIGDNAFAWCDCFNSIVISDSVTSIGDGAFAWCDSLTSITVDENNKVYHSAGNCIIETASKTLIVGCNNSVIPNDGSVTSIGEDAFYGCDSLESIVIPDSITIIGDGAFLMCWGLSSVTFGNSVTEIGDGAFDACYLESITIPSSVKSIGHGAFYSRCVESITVDKNNKVYHSDGNCLIETASKTLITGCINSVIPGDGSVTVIADYAFNDACYNLEKLVIPNSITKIGECAFGFTGYIEYDYIEQVIYCGTKAEFNKIEIGDENEGLLYSDIIYHTTHKYDNSCDSICNVCGYERVAPHNISGTWKNDGNSHWQYCSGCKQNFNSAAHVFDNASDTICNVCGYTRTISHSYVTKRDSEEHWKECSVCGDKKDIAAHSFNEKGICKICGYNSLYSMQASVALASASRGGEVTLRITLSSELRNKLQYASGSISFAELPEGITLKSGSWSIAKNPDGMNITSFKNTDLKGVFTLDKSIELPSAEDQYGVIFTATFAVDKNCTFGDKEISANIQLLDAERKAIAVENIPGIIAVCGDYTPGDLDGDKKITPDDATYIIYSIFFPDDYPLNQLCDFDGNGKVNVDDATYLLYSIFFPEDYPL